MPQAAASTRPSARRPWWRRPRFIVPAVVVSAIAALYAAADAYLGWRADRRYREAAAEADRLDPGWRLDDLLARREKVPDDVNSALRVREIAARLPSGWPGPSFYDGRRLNDGRPDIRLDPKRRDELQAIFDSAAEVAPAARALADFPRGNYEGPRPAIRHWEQIGRLNAYRDVNFPYGETVHRVVYLLWLDAALRIDDGDFATALTDIRAMIHAGRSVGDYPGMSAQQTRDAEGTLAVSRLERLLAQGQVDATSLAALQALLEDEAAQPIVMVALRGERAKIDDFLEQLHAGKVGLDAIPEWSGLPFWFKAFISRRSLRDNQTNLLRFHTEAVEVGKRPEREQIDAMLRVNRRLTDRYRQNLQNHRAYARDTPEKQLMGLVTGEPQWHGMTSASLRAAIVALAAERFRLDHDRWPESLDPLVPTYLKAIPADPFADGPLKLRRFDDGLLIYSNSYDRRDDGGNVDWDMQAGAHDDQGFRLWDPGRRRKPHGAVSGEKIHHGDTEGTDKRETEKEPSSPPVFSVSSVPPW